MWRTVESQKNKLVFNNDDSSLLVVWLRWKVPTSFKISFRSLSGEPDLFFKYSGHRNYFFGYSIERQFYSDLKALPKDMFPKELVLAKFPDSERIDPRIRKFIVKKINRF